MKHLVINLKLLCALSLIGSASMASPENSVLNSMPLTAKQALTKWNFKFKMFSENEFIPEVLDLFKGSAPNEKPMKLTLDLNNDKVEDYILLGEADKQQYVVALVSEKNSFKAIVVDNWSEANFKKNSAPTGKDRREGVILYLAIPPQEDEATVALKKKAQGEIFDLESYMGPSKVFAIKNYKAVKLNE